MSDKHTGGKWYTTGMNVRQDSSDYVICNIDDGGHCDDSIILISPLEQEANAERIVACVNALDGISNEALEAGVVEEMVNVFKTINKKEEFDGSGIGNIAIAILSKLEPKP